MIRIWGVRLNFGPLGYEYMTLGSKWQAEYFLHLMPQMMVDGNAMVEGIQSARLFEMEMVGE